MANPPTSGTWLAWARFKRCEYVYILLSFKNFCMYFAANVDSQRNFKSLTVFGFSAILMCSWESLLRYENSSPSMRLLSRLPNNQQLPFSLVLHRSPSTMEALPVSSTCG
jgi:hypothetical protein